MTRRARLVSGERRRWPARLPVLAVALSGLISLLVAPAEADVVTLFPTANATSGTVTGPTEAYSQNDTGALISSNNSSLVLSGFDSTDLGTITDVTVFVRYQTNTAPGNDTYQFDAAINGTAFDDSIVAASTANETAYVVNPPSGVSLGALTWAQVGTLAIRAQTTRNGGNDNYQVDWDVGYIEVTYTPPSFTTTLGNGTDPTATPTLCPGGLETALDGFSFVTDGNSDVVNSVTVGLAAGTGEALSLLEISDPGGSPDVYGSQAAPVSDSQSVTLGNPTTLTATTAPAVDYEVRITPKAHADMPDPASEQEYTVTGTITSFVPATNSTAGSDGGSDTITIDNLSPGVLTWGTVTPGDSQVTLNWNNPSAFDVIIVRDLATISATPTEGKTDYAANGTDSIGGPLVVYVGSGTSFNDNGVENASIPAPTNGTTYYYKLFSYDTCGNYSYSLAAQETSATPSAGGNIAPTFSGTQADDGVTQAANITTCSGSTVSISSTVNDGDSDPVDWAVYSGQNPTFSVCNSATGAAVPASATCNLGAITQTTDYYIWADDATDTATDPSGAPASFYTVTVDSTAPADASFSGCTGVSTTRIDLTFSDPGTAQGGGVVVVRGMPAGTAPNWTPTQGAAPPTQGTTDGGTGDYFLFVGTGTSASDTSLTEDQLYQYAVWSYDGCNNYQATAGTTSCSTQAPVSCSWSPAQTDGDMETAGVAAWEVTEIVASSVQSNAKDTNGGNGSSQALLTSSIADRRIPVGWYNANTPALGAVDPASDQVRLSLWYAAQVTLSTGGGAIGTVYVDVKPTASGSWTNAWNQAVTLSTTKTVGASLPSQFDITSAFVGGATTYEFRLRFEGQTGNDTNSQWNVWWDDVVVEVCSTPSVVITVGEGGADTSAAICPGTNATGIALDNFTLSADSPVTATAVQVTLATDNNLGLSSVQIRDGSEVELSSAAADADTVNVGGLSLNLDAAPDPYEVWVVPETHLNMPLVPGSTISVTGTVSDVTAPGASVTDNDNTSATITIDNQSPSDPGGFSATAGDSEVVLSWNALGGDVNEVVVLRRQTDPVASAPAEGSDYDAGNVGDAVGSSTIAYVGTGTGFTDGGLTNGETYNYKIFAKDACGNYSEGVASDGHQPTSTDGTVAQPSSVVANSCENFTVVTEFDDDTNNTSETKVEYDTDAAFAPTPDPVVACAKMLGGSPRECLVSGLTPNTTYYFRVTHTDAADGVTGTSQPEILDNGGPGYDTGTCSADKSPPTISYMSPTRGGRIGGTDRAQVQVYDESGSAGLTVLWSVDGGAETAATVNANLDCDDPSDTTCTTCCEVYYFDVDTTPSGLNLPNGAHFLTVKATDADGNVAQRSQAVVVQNLADGSGTPAGDGFLLRRTRGSQLCVDCHDLKTHSSQKSTKYGAWSLECLTCHSTHSTRNAFLIRETIRTPNSGDKTVVFKTPDLQNTASPPDESFVGAMTGAPGSRVNTTAGDGVCEVCHTKTGKHNSAAPDTHEVNNAGGLKCTDCHGHTGGFGAPACNGCHNAPPTVGRHLTHDEVAELPTQYDNLSTTTTATDYGFACGKCHSGTHISDTDPGDNYQVEISFDATVSPTNPSGNYTANVTKSVDSTSYGDFEWSDGSCSNLYCHSNANRIAGLTYATPTWDQAQSTGTARCIACHDAGGEGTGLSGAHETHTNSTTVGADYGFGCVRCHDTTLGSTVTDIQLDPTDLDNKTAHVDGVRTVAFDASSVNNSAGSYDGLEAGDTKTCSDTYCHSSGKDRTAPYTSGPSIAWDTTATCTSCHAGGGSGTTLSGPHEGHTTSGAGFADAYGCIQCHSNTVASDSAISAAGVAQHVDGEADVVPTEDSGSPPATSPVFTPGAEGAGSCSNLYCHSSGQATPTYRTPAWNDAPLSNVCTKCHGTGGSTFGAPDYASGGEGADDANSHPAHVGGSSACANCHNSTTTNGTSIANESVHIDGDRQISIAPAYDGNGGTGSDNYTAGTKTCSGLNGSTCHGPQTWGGPSLVCLDCHGDPTTDTDDWVYGNGTIARIAEDEWVVSGHGATSAYAVTNNPAADFGNGGSEPNPCLYCHDSGIGHNSTTNPFRLRKGAGSGLDDWALTCLVCHGDNGVNAAWGVGIDLGNGAGTVGGSAVTIDSYHAGTNHGNGQDSANGGSFCWDCHDPHGDRDSGGGNIIMIHDEVTRVSDGVYGIPDTSIVHNPPTQAGGQVTPVFTNRGFANMGTGSPFNGICNVCHTDPAMDNYKWDSADTGHPADPAGETTCSNSNCHSHTNGTANAFAFGATDAPDNCLKSGCHDAAAGTRRAVLDDFTKQSHHVGNDAAAGHSDPNMGGELTKWDCVVCHAEGRDDGVEVDPIVTSQHANGVIDLWDVDSSFASYFTYDVDAIANVCSGGTNDGASCSGDGDCTGGGTCISRPASDWNSSVQVWREWTSGIDESGGATLPANAGLDPFCLTCHDDDGATGTGNFRDTGGSCSSLNSTTNDPQNPFCDLHITNEVDGAYRYDPPVIRDGSPAVPPGSEGPEKVVNVYDQVVDGGSDVDGDGSTDPPDGVYARHAIRGQGTSRYSIYQNLPSECFGPAPDLTPNQPCYSIYEGWGGNTPQFTSMGTDELGNPVWNDTSVMGCADCHTTDGSNTTAGNAHGSNSEYLLKDASGGATEGTLGGTSYVCYRCHQSSVHKEGVGHTANKSDYVDTTASGPNFRVLNDRGKATTGVIFGIACLNCHGAPDWGTIHGTSQQFERPDSSVRQAYRFMNGGSQRYFVESNSWAGSSVTCWTLGAEDEWGSCTQHDGGYDWEKPLVRKLSY